MTFTGSESSDPLGDNGGLLLKAGGRSSGSCGMAICMRCESNSSNCGKVIIADDSLGPALKLPIPEPNIGPRALVLPEEEAEDMREKVGMEAEAPEDTREKVGISRNSMPISTLEPCEDTEIRSGVTRPSEPTLACFWFFSLWRLCGLPDTLSRGSRGRSCWGIGGG